MSGQTIGKAPARLPEGGAVKSQPRNSQNPTELPTSNLRPPTSNLQPPNSNHQPHTSNLQPPNPLLQPPTSHLQPPTTARAGRKPNAHPLRLSPPDILMETRI